MAGYIINTSTKATVTVNLVQGRVQIAPLSYCELHDQDLEKAKAIYNSNELNLYVAETEKEVQLILGKKEQEDTTQENTDANPVPGDNDENSKENVGSSDNKENDLRTDANVDPVPEGANEDSANKAKQQVINIIEELRAESNLDKLKELASELGVSFAYNIGFDALASKIADFIEK
jgi:hypothetical protein